MPPDLALPLRPDPVRQFTIFADNKVGRLHDLILRLSDRQVHVMAFSLVDTTETVLFRLIVDYPEEAREILRQYGYPFTESQVVAVEFPSAASLREVTAALVEAEINIHYAYPFVIRPRSQAALALSVEEPDLAASVLSARGLRTLAQADIAR